VRITEPRANEPIRLIRTGNRHRYRVVLDVAPPDAPRRQVTRTFATIKAARAFVTETRAGITSGTYTPPTAETVTDLSARWLDTRRDIRPVTLEGYGNHLAPVLRRLGHRQVQSLTPADMDGLVAWLTREGGARGQGLAPRSVKAALVALGQVLDMALREGTVTRNVARLARRPRVRKVAGTDLLHWQPDHLVAFVEHADTDPLAAAWRLTACGMTRADVLGLRWTDADLDTGVVSISQGRVALDRSDHTDDPKSEARRRALPVEQMWPGTVDRLRSLSARQAADRLRLGPGYGGSLTASSLTVGTASSLTVPTFVDGPGLVVVDAVGRPVRPEWYSDRFRALAREAGLPPITLHAVRHSLAFWLHREGVTPADAAALLGHTVEVHLSTYLPHSGASGITSAARALGRAAAAE
jgi:integrase